MKEREIWNKDRTANPELWQYWTNSGAMDFVIENRNRFAIEYNLAPKQPEHYPLKLWLDKNNMCFDFDHFEAYKTRDGKWVCINSPYMESEDRDIKFACLGLKKIYPLYYGSAVTYVRVIDDARSHRWDYDQAERVYEAMKALEKFC